VTVTLLADVCVRARGDRWDGFYVNLTRYFGSSLRCDCFREKLAPNVHFSRSSKLIENMYYHSATLNASVTFVAHFFLSQGRRPIGTRTHRHLHGAQQGSDVDP
jgi:hypothetical protein